MIVMKKNYSPQYKTQDIIQDKTKTKRKYLTLMIFKTQNLKN